MSYYNELDFTSQNSLQVLSPRQIRGKLNYGPFPGANSEHRSALCARLAQTALKIALDSFGAVMDYSKEIEIVHRLSLVRFSYCVGICRVKLSKNRQKYLLITWEVSLTLIVALAVNSIRLEKTYILFEFP